MILGSFKFIYVLTELVGVGQLSCQLTIYNKGSLQNSNIVKLGKIYQIGVFNASLTVAYCC